VGVDAAVDAVEVAQAHHDLFQRGVAGPLAEAVHRGVGMGGAGPEGGQGVGGGQAQVVVGVHFDADVDPPPQGGDGVVGREGIEDAEGVGEADAHRAGPLGGFGHFAEEGGIGAGGIFAAHRHGVAGVRALRTKRSTWSAPSRGCGLSLPRMWMSETGIERFRVSTGQARAAAGRRRSSGTTPSGWPADRGGQFRWIASISTGPMTGMPISISLTPTAASWAMAHFSSRVKATPAVCSPSRRVVSLMMVSGLMVGCFLSASNQQRPCHLLDLFLVG
jgi:hypothetical protein